MSSKITIQTLDTDGAVQEAAERAGFSTRSDFFKKSIYAGGTLAAGGILMGGMPALASAAAPSAKQDIEILNFALTLEYLEAAFYKQGVAGAGLSADAKSLAKTISTHEDAHVKFLEKALGSKAVKKPKFDFGKAVTDADTFLATAFVLENTGVDAYLGQAGNFKNPAYLGAAATILTIEARHAGAIAQLTGKKVSPSGSFDKGKSKAAILSAVKKTKFITG